VEHVVEDKRERELQAEFESRKKQPRILMMTPILVQTSKIYTSVIFEAFQAEYEKSLAVYIIDSNRSTEFSIAIGALVESSTLEEERTVIVNLVDQIVTCSCRLFERIGILCRHALKGLDLMNIKLLPERYILKRWTRGTRSEIIQDMLHFGTKIFAGYSFHWLHELLILKIVACLLKRHFTVSVSRWKENKRNS
jgi:zinc finger SWIM domain-containing protein 3